MNALELINYLNRKQVSATFAAARQLPADKLNWQPAPGARSALDQVQEFATAVTEFWELYTTGKMEWDENRYKNWYAERSKITDLDELERMANADADRLAEFFKTISPDDLTKKIQLPFPGDYTMADSATYHYWNGAYHEGQINYIASLLDEKS